MVLRAQSLDKKEEPKKEERVGEIRLDSEGRGYFHVFGKKDPNRPEEVEQAEPKEAAPKKKKKKSRK